MIYRTSSDGCFRVLLTQLKNVVTTQHTVFIYIKHLLESNSFKFCHPYLNFTEIDYSWWLYTVSNHRVLQRAMRELCNEWQVNFCNEQLLQRAMSYLGTSNNWKVTPRLFDVMCLYLNINKTIWPCGLSSELSSNVSIFSENLLFYYYYYCYYYYCYYYYWNNKPHKFPQVVL